MKLCNNEQIRAEIAKKNIDILFAGETEEKKEEILKSFLADTKRLELHNRALAIQEEIYKKQAIKKQLQAEYTALTGKTLNYHNFDRVAYINMDTSGTPEAKRKNMEYLISLNDINFAKKETGRVINMVRKFDISKTAFNTMEEAIALAEQNHDMYEYMYVFCDILKNINNDLSFETKQYIADKTPVIQQGNNPMRFVDYCLTNSHLTLPDGYEDEAYANSKKLAKVMGEYINDIDGIELNPKGATDKNTMTAIGIKYDTKDILSSMENTPKLYADGTIPKNVCEYNCKINGVPEKLDTGLLTINTNPEGVTFDKIPDDEAAKIEQDLLNPKQVAQNKESTSKYQIKSFFDNNPYFILDPLEEQITTENVYYFKKNAEVTADINEEIINVIRAAKDISKEGKADFEMLYKKNYTSAFRKIYKDVLLNNTGISYTTVDGVKTLSIQSDLDVKDKVMTALMQFDTLMMDITEKTLSSIDFKDTIKFNRKNWVLGGHNPETLLETAGDFIWKDTAIKGYQERFVNDNSTNLTGTAKYLADGHKIFSQVSELNRSLNELNNLPNPLKDQTDIANHHMAIAILQKDAAAIYATMRQEHRNHKLLWRIFKGSESRRQLKEFKTEYCRAFGLNVKTATNAILRVANGSSELEVTHKAVIRLLTNNKELSNYKTTTEAELSNAANEKKPVTDLEFNNDEKTKENQELFSDLDASVIEIKEDELDNLTDDDIPQINQ